MYAIRDSLEQTFEEFLRCLAICLLHELGNCKLAGPVNTNKEIELALDRLNFRDIDMKEADRVTLELLALGFVAFDTRKARNAMPLKALM
jgi:hypothetical protein